jgi:nitrate/nitrite transport system permease protein
MKSQAYHLLFLDDSWWMKTIRGTFYFAGGCLIIGLLWTAVSRNSYDTSMETHLIPSISTTFEKCKIVFDQPFRTSDNEFDSGIFWVIWSSIKRVSIGFLYAMLVGIPIGILMGANKLAGNILNPVVQILRPVSPLVWLILAMYVIRAVPESNMFMIFITCIWPTIINTSFGVASIPEDYKNVSKAFDFSVWKYVTKVVLPFATPHIITGMRLSIGIAWMVIVAGEMLSGANGIGFFAWNSYNSQEIDSIMISIFVIGLVGIMLDKLFDFLHKSFAYESK